MKTFLLIAGSNYYPQSRTNDWIDTFSTHKEAESVVEELPKGKREFGSYKIKDQIYDWYEIVDLEEWINK